MKILTAILVIALLAFTGFAVSGEALLLRDDPLSASGSNPIKVEAVACTYLNGWTAKTVKIDRERCPGRISVKTLDNMQELP
jgi:hypothetical protein